LSLSVTRDFRILGQRSRSNAERKTARC